MERRIAASSASYICRACGLCLGDPEDLREGHLHSVAVAVVAGFGMY